MITKQTREQKELLLAKAREAQRRLELGMKPWGNAESRTILAEWRKFNKLPSYKQQQMRDEWNKYFEDVSFSPIYQLVQAQKEAMRDGNWARVKDLADQSKQMREDGALNTVTKPQGIDPMEFDRSSTMKAYWDCENVIKELSFMEEEAEDRNVWNER